MKLSIICEVFDKLNMDGVEVMSRTETRGRYTFTDPNLQDPILYVVKIYRHYKQPEDYLEDYLAVNYGLAEDKGKTVVSDGIYLESEQHGFGLTNAANQFFVYNKLLACIKDYWSHSGLPIFIEFSGSISAMNITYDKLLSRAGKIDPLFQFVPFDDEVYIRADIARSLPAELNANSMLDRAERAYRERIDSLKAQKQRWRKFDRGNFY